MVMSVFTGLGRVFDSFVPCIYGHFYDELPRCLFSGQPGNQNCW